MKFTLEFDLPEGLEDDEKIYGEWAVRSPSPLPSRSSPTGQSICS